MKMDQSQDPVLANSSFVRRFLKHSSTFSRHPIHFALRPGETSIEEKNEEKNGSGRWFVSQKNGNAATRWLVRKICSRQCHSERERDWGYPVNLTLHFSTMARIQRRSIWCSRVEKKWLNEKNRSGFLFWWFSLFKFVRHFRPQSKPTAQRERDKSISTTMEVNFLFGACFSVDPQWKIFSSLTLTDSNRLITSLFDFLFSGNW